MTENIWKIRWVLSLHMAMLCYCHTTLSFLSFKILIALKIIGLNNYYNYFPNNNCVEVYKLLNCIVCHLLYYFMTDWFLFCLVLLSILRIERKGWM